MDEKESLEFLKSKQGDVSMTTEEKEKVLAAIKKLYGLFTRIPE